MRRERIRTLVAALPALALAVVGLLAAPPAGAQPVPAAHSPRPPARPPSPGTPTP